MKPIVRKCLALGTVNACLAIYFPAGWWWNFAAGLSAVCFIKAAYHYKPPKVIDDEMDVEQWIKLVYAYLYNKANA